MTKLTKVEGFKKGDIITRIETRPMCGEETATFVHKFEIIRNNPKTYGCKYIEGPLENTGFNWIKGYDLTQNTTVEYFIG